MNSTCGISLCVQNQSENNAVNTGRNEEMSHGLKIHVSPVRSRLCPLPLSDANGPENQAEMPDSGPLHAPSETSPISPELTTGSLTEGGSPCGVIVGPPEDPDSVALDLSRCFGRNHYGGPADGRLAAAMRQVQGNVQRAMLSDISASKHLPEALKVLDLACRNFIAWHERVESPFDIAVSFVGGKCLVTVTDHRGKEVFEWDKRWRNNGFCSALDVALATGQPISYIEGLEDGFRTVQEIKLTARADKAESPEFIGIDAAAKAVGVPRSVMQAWVDAGVAPYYTFRNVEGIWFRLSEIRRWSTAYADRQGGLDVPRIEVNSERGERAALGRIPDPIRNVEGLRELRIDAAVSGIYFLCHGGEVVYVGQSVSVYSRVATHRSERTKNFTSAFFILCPENQLNRVERQFIELLMPIYNSDSKTVSQRFKASAAVSPHPREAPPAQNGAIK